MRMRGGELEPITDEDIARTTYVKYPQAHYLITYYGVNPRYARL